MSQEIEKNCFKLSWFPRKRWIDVRARGLFIKLSSSYLKLQFF